MCVGGVVTGNQSIRSCLPPLLEGYEAANLITNYGTQLIVNKDKKFSAKCFTETKYIKNQKVITGFGNTDIIGDH
jgi:hypothetical protein